jgi:hypothetical protein
MKWPAIAPLGAVLGILVGGALVLGTCREEGPRKRKLVQVGESLLPRLGAKAPFSRSKRCGECHERIHDEWQTSAHARATTSKAYTRALGSLPQETRALCQRCHLPGLVFGQAPDAPGRPSEGVSCDGCHLVRSVQLGEGGGAPDYDAVSGKKYGPLADPAGNYFHGMARSDLHTRSEQCAACHHMLSFTLGADARNIPVVTDYQGWQRHGRERPCQGCHMPSRGTMPVARGSRPRKDVPAHAFPASASRGLRLEHAVDLRAGLLTVELTHGAGHPLPSGYVDRRLILQVVFQNRAGTEVARAERAFGVFLDDTAGKPAPFFQAARVREDRRLVPDKTHAFEFDIPEPVEPGREPARAVITLYAAATAPELAAAYGPPELVPLKTATRSLGTAAGRFIHPPAPDEPSERRGKAAPPGVLP